MLGYPGRISNHIILLFLIYICVYVVFKVHSSEIVKNMRGVQGESVFKFTSLQRVIQTCFKCAHMILERHKFECKLWPYELLKMSAVCRPSIVVFCDLN